MRNGVYQTVTENYRPHPSLTMNIYALKVYQIMGDSSKLLVKMISIVPEEKIFPLKPERPKELAFLRLVYHFALSTETKE